MLVDLYNVARTCEINLQGVMSQAEEDSSIRFTRRTRDMVHGETSVVPGSPC